MRFICIVLCLMLSSCSYYGKTIIRAKGRDVKAIVGNVPIKGDADVVLNRVCKWTIWAEVKDEIQTE